MGFTERSETDEQACADTFGCDTFGAHPGGVSGNPHPDSCSNICKNGHIHSDWHGYACPDQHGQAFTHQHSYTYTNQHDGTYVHAGIPNPHSSAADVYAHTSATNPHEYASQG
jgi:hypothetical protein